jgi:4-hydroxybenzoate polyprenyltransferase
MNQAHYHLLFNHLPIIVPTVGLLVLIGGLAVKSEIVKRTAYFIFILGSLATITAIATGDGAEEAVEQIEGISKGMIHEHEEKAELFAILSYVLGVASAFALWGNLRKKSYADYIAYAIIAYSCIVLYFAQQTGTSGGEIRHSEIRSGTSIIQ